MMARSHVAAALAGVALAAASTQVNGADKGTDSGGDAAVGANQRLGQRMAAEEYGWSGDQWTCLKELWTRESGWDPDAVNPTSGAYGIAQILPDAHGYPVALGDAEAQIEWGLDYIADRYGDPCTALDFHDRKNWY